MLAASATGKIRALERTHNPTLQLRRLGMADEQDLQAIAKREVGHGNAEGIILREGKGREGKKGAMAMAMVVCNPSNRSREEKAGERVCV